MAADAAADGLARLPFGKFLPLVAALDAHVFALDFMDFAVDEQPGFLTGRLMGLGFSLGAGFSTLSKRSLVLALPDASS